MQPAPPRSTHRKVHGLDPAILPQLLTLARATTESLAFVFLTKTGQALGLHHLPGTAPASIDVSLRPVVAAAMAHGSTHIIMAHNHPSGDPEPTAEDLRTTRRVATALETLGIRLVDHLVLAAGGSVSFRDRGLL